MALVPDQKFSTFQNGGDLETNDIIVGLRNGLNTRFTYTGALPTGVIIPIANGGTGADNAPDARTNLGLGTMAVQNANAVAITGGTAALASGSVVAAPVNPTDIANMAYVQSLVGTSVQSVSGTLNRVTSTGGINPVIDISASYVGQTSLTTLGTITTGTWNGTAIDLATYVSGNLAVSHLNSGTGASASTFWCGDGTWKTAGSTVTPAALTKVDDTNVTLTLGGTPATALLQATSITAGWTGQLSVPRGGTGLATATAFAVLCGGTTSTGAFQSVASVGSLGQVLTSNGAGVLPTFQTLASGGGLKNFTAITATGTWTRTSGSTKAVIMVLGGGAGGSGATGVSGSFIGTGDGGGAGETAWLELDISAIASSAVTIGAGGAGGPAAAGSTGGSSGGTTSFGAHVSAVGGSGGSPMTTDGSFRFGVGGLGGTGGAGGDIQCPGFNGRGAIRNGASGGVSGGGASSSYGRGGLAVDTTSGDVNGNAATGYGSGGGAAISSSSAQRAGGAGRQGLILVWEY